MKNKLIWLIAFITIAHLGVAQSQINRYFIYFTDKAGENYPYSISNPEEFLTQRAIERREKQEISIKEDDLPVSPEYVQGLRDAGIDVYFTSRWMNGALVNADTSLLDDVSQLSFVDSIAWIADTTRLSAEKSIPDYPDSFDPPTSQSGDSDIQLIMLGADTMHEDDIKGQGMLIAVLDNGFTGVNRFTPFHHVWENNRIIATKDFVENSGDVFQFGDHGTSVFSIIAANYTSTDGDLIGIAPEAEYILCVTEEGGSEDRVEEYNWLLGAEFADSLGADVINASLGYNTFDITEHDYSKEDLDGKTAIVSIAAETAAKKGMVVVTSAGNSGRRNPPGNLINHPADADRILAVGSVDPNFERSAFSSVGPTADGRIKPDIAAFGDGTAVMSGNGSIERGGGTSFASPLIAGFAACIWQMNPERTANEVIAAIKNSGHLDSNPDNLLGWGVPNYMYAKDVKALNITDILEDKVTIYPNPFIGDTLYLLTDGKFNTGMTIKILDPKGSLIFNQEFKKKEIKENMELKIDSSQQGVYFLFLQTGNSQKIVKLINF
ncbi:S8 family serine peptidase [Ekhidna sp.]|uniref:S8 family serine peptidase n=1 Tax=Ekhidna sp. TaxID=2608089 RepID=UPI003CCBCEB3